MREINSRGLGVPTGIAGSGIPKAENHRRECVSDNNSDGLKRTNLMDADDNGNALIGGYGAYGEDSGYGIYEGKVSGGDTEAGGVSTFVEIPMAGDDRGRNIQITGFQVSMGKDEAIESPDHVRRTHRNEATNDDIGLRNAEVVIQAGGVNLLIYKSPIANGAFCW